MSAPSRTEHLAVFATVSATKKRRGPMLLSESRLTEPDPEIAKFRSSTHAGQAHWGGTGPAAATCRQCEHWRSRNSHEIAATRGDDPPPGAPKKPQFKRTDGALSPRRCRKFRALSHGYNGPAVPHDAPACKHFIANPEPPVAALKRAPT